MMISCNAPPFLWDEFAVTAAYLHTCSPSKSQLGRTPFEVFERKKPNILHLREIGCRVFVLVRGHNPKLCVQSIKCVLIGYTPQAKAYRCWERSSGKIYNSIDVQFIEANETICVKLKKDLLAACPSEATVSEPTVPNDQSLDNPPLNTSAPPLDAILAPPPPIPSAPVDPVLRRSERTRCPPTRTVAFACPVDGDDDGKQSILDTWDRTVAATPEDDDGEEMAMLTELNAYLSENPIDVEYPDDLNNYAEAMASPDTDKWITGTREELAVLRKEGGIQAHPTISCTTQQDDPRPLCRVHPLEGNIVCNKVRYCIKGFRAPPALNPFVPFSTSLPHAIGMSNRSTSRQLS
jgi:hypothetical protein